VNVDFGSRGNLLLLSQLVDIRIQAIHRSPATLDEVKLEWQAYVGSESGLQRNDRGTVLSRSITAGSSEPVNVNDSFKVCAAAEDGEPSAVIRLK
jgi:hypothetical protein